MTAMDIGTRETTFAIAPFAIRGHPDPHPGTGLRRYL